MSSPTTNFCRDCKRLEGVIQMKVLFAVNSESISDAIIKKYQKDYREILSYKNVYYFNAIQKEIQKDKSYDRIVISADLEPFSNSNYESIDKFIFEKLDGISDEAHDTSGNEISIILICSDRHTKGSSFLVKLFSLGIYNGLLGNDRSMEEVCRLINKPRTKKEAKMYYKIDTDDVNYRMESEDEVDELQIQNILYHFRRLGKNTDKYAGSFENIAAQYTDEQLKIVINCLPANVKKVLEETSSKYQEIMAASGAMVQGIKSSSIADKEAQKRTGLKIDIIENKLNQTKVNGPIVIPNSVKTTSSANAKRVIAVPQKGQNVQTVQPQVKKTAQPVQASNQTKKITPELKGDNVNSKKIEPTNQNEKLVRLPNGKIVRKKIVPKQTKTEIEPSVPTKTVKPVRKTAENRTVAKQPMQVSKQLNEVDDLDFLTVKSPVNSTVKNEEPNVVEQPKKGRGRPRKNPIEAVEKPKGKRGRPRKNPIEEMIQEEKPNLELEELQNQKIVTEQPLNMDLFEHELIPESEEVVKNNEFEDFILEEEEIIEPVESISNDETNDIELPQLDELDDIDEFDDEEQEIFDDITEESFDEFEDYDEYGQYETKVTAQNEEEDIDQLYEEDILSDEASEFEELDADNFEEFEEVTEDAFETALEEDEFDMSSLDEENDDLDMDFVSEENDDFGMNFEEQNNTEDEEDDDTMLLSDFDDADDILSAVDMEEESTDNLLDFEDENDTLEEDTFADAFAEDFEEPQSQEPTMPNYESNYQAEGIQSIDSSIDYSMSNLNSLMTKDKKIVTFLGSTKNGVSFLVSNLAEVFASVGINTAILDMTQNRNSYYIYTQNEEALRQVAYTSIEKLQNGVANGIKVKQNLTVYTALPNDEKDYSNVEGILSTLVQNHSLVLVDCDFNTNPAYFASCQEIYLVQSMDILTIQPLTAFLRDLKAQGVFEPEKVRVVINKELKVRGLTAKAIIGGMSSYNDPAMSFMTELFDKESVKYCSIPFEEMAYSKYLEGMLNCKVSLNGYSKNFMSKLRMLGDMVYPLTSRQTYSSNEKQNYKQNSFSNSMNSTLNKMKKNY